MLMMKSTLQFYVANGTISLDEIMSLGQEATMRTIIERVHKYAIKRGAGKDTRYVTYVSDATRPQGRRQIKKNTLTEMYNYLLEFYGVQAQKELLFSELYDEWVQYKKQFVGKKNKGLTDTTIYRYQLDFCNYIKNSPLANELITQLNKPKMDLYLKDIVEYNNDKEDIMLESCAKNVFGYISNALEYACDMGYIGRNPTRGCKDLMLSYCAVSEEKARVLKLSEFSAYINAVKAHQRKYPNYMANYVIELALLTGMRVGELVALHWSDIDNRYIHVDYSEHRHDYIDRPSIITIGEPKNRKHRVIPLNDAMRELFQRIKALGRDSDFVFVDENGERLRANPVTAASRRRAKDAGLEKCSIHCIRRTVSSMLNEVLEQQAVASMLGHLPTTNERFYNYDVHEDDEKISALNTVSSFVINNSGYKIA